MLKERDLRCFLDDHPDFAGFDSIDEIAYSRTQRHGSHDEGEVGVE